MKNYFESSFLPSWELWYYKCEGFPRDYYEIPARVKILDLFTYNISHRLKDDYPNLRDIVVFSWIYHVGYIA